MQPTKKSNSEEPLRRAKGKAELSVQIQACERASAAEARAKSVFPNLLLQIFSKIRNWLTISLRKGVRETQRGSGLLRTQHLPIRRARAAGRLQTRTTKLRSRNASRISEVLPLETIETKKSETGRPSENENVPIQVEGSVGQEESETKVFLSHDNTIVITQLRNCLYRLRSLS